MEPVETKTYWHQALVSLLLCHVSWDLGHVRRFMKSPRPHWGEGFGCLNAKACRKFKLSRVIRACYCIIGQIQQTCGEMNKALQWNSMGPYLRHGAWFRPWGQVHLGHVQLPFASYGVDSLMQSKAQRGCIYTTNSPVCFGCSIN